MIIDEEYVKHPYCCLWCLRVYQWSADDLAWAYEASPHMPCGHPWLYRRDMEDDLRIFQVTTYRADDPLTPKEVNYHTRSDLKVAYPGLYRIVKSPTFTSLKIFDDPTSIELRTLSPEEARRERQRKDDEEQAQQRSTSPFEEEPDDV